MAPQANPTTPLLEFFLPGVVSFARTSNRRAGCAGSI